MLNILKQYLNENSLFKPSDRLLLAVSGGVDSMVMLHLFEQLPYTISVAHVNFQLRAEESDGDETFVRQYCKSKGIPLFVHKADTHTYMREHKVSVQMAAREIRYAWFKELMQEHSYDKLLVAQHSDDSVETTMINLLRGTGLSGLKGITSNSIAMRPMLCFSRADILSYAEQHEINWREDSSNKKSDYLRNKLRNEILPQLDEISDAWRSHIVQLNRDVEAAEHILNDYYIAHISILYKNNVINTDALHTERHSKWMFRKLLLELGFTHDTISDIELNTDIQTGKFYESEKVILRKQADGFFVEHKNNMVSAPSSFWLYADDAKLNICGTELAVEYVEIDKAGSAGINYEKGYLYLDADKLIFPLYMRKWQAGDRFRPLGMNGFKKLSDYFVDKKITIQQKENTFVMLSEGNIVCILGHQIDDRYKISEQSKRIYRIKYING